MGDSVLFFVALVSFFLMHQAPGGPFDKDNNKKQVDGATLKALNARFGLDKPQYFNPWGIQQAVEQRRAQPFKIARAYLDSQFFNYIFNAARGDLGPSYRQRGKSVQDIIFKQWPYSVRLGLFALIFAVVVGVPLGVIAALRQNSLADYLSLFFATIGVSIPTFVIGLLVIIFFGTTLKWISITNNDWDTWRPYIAPGLVLGLSTMSFITRITRTTVLEVKQARLRAHRAGKAWWIAW
ncbi:MAG: ABC transporter permease [Kouleothrix sp.]